MTSSFLVFSPTRKRDAGHQTPDRILARLKSPFPTGGDKKAAGRPLDLLLFSATRVLLLLMYQLVDLHKSILHLNALKISPNGKSVKISDFYEGPLRISATALIGKP